MTRGSLLALALFMASPAAAAPQSWRFFDDAPSPFLQYSTRFQADVHRTTIACDGPPRVVLVEQGLTARQAAAAAQTMTITIGRARLAAPVSFAADVREDGPGQVASAQFDGDGPDVARLATAGPVIVALGGVRFQRPPISRAAMRSFLAICRSQWTRPVRR